MKALIIAILIFSSSLAFPQMSQKDSLKKELILVKNELNQAKLLIDLSNLYINTKIDSAVLLANQAIKILDNKKSDSLICLLYANAYNSIGISYNNKGNYKQAAGSFEKAIYYDQKSKNYKKATEKILNLAIIYKSMGDYSKALSLYDSSLKVAGQYSYMNLYAMTKVNMGVLNYEIGNYDNALKDYYEALELKKQEDDKNTVAILLYNIGLIYDEREDIEKANKNYFQALDLFREKENLYGEAYCLGCIGSNYVKAENYIDAIDYYNKAYEIHEKLENKQGMGEAFGEIGIVYYQNNKYRKATEFYNLSLNLYKEIGYIRGVITILQRLGEIELKKENYREAQKLFILSKTKADSIKDKPQLKGAYEYLSETYLAMSDYKNAYINYKKYSVLKDSIFTEEAEDNITKLNAQHDISEREAQIKLLQNERTVQDLKIRKQKILIFSVLLGFILISLFLLILFRQIKTIRTANRLLAYQKKQITDSIEYASRIQTAILPPGDYINKIIPDHFILYKPRDIVSGDFYWITHKDGKIIVAAVDCTGHGVPGAFMSMLGFAFLNEIVNKEKELKANEILNQLRDNVKKSLHQTGKDDEAKDGMDIALCIIDLENLKMQFSGAYNPLYLARNNELITLKGDRMPIGIYIAEKESFTNHETEISKGDTIYIFTDGYTDQFGGPQTQKFKTAPFRDLIESNQDKSMAEQKKILEDNFDKWKGDYDQIDDVLVIGIKI